MINLKKNFCYLCNKNTKKFYSLRFYFYKCESCFSFFRSAKHKLNLFDLFKNTPLKIFSNYAKAKDQQFIYYKSLIEDYLNKKENFSTEKTIFLKELIASNPNLKVIDIGGSPGISASILKENNLVKDIVVTDYNEDIVKKMQSDLNLRSIKVDFDDLNTELFTEKFDLIILWNVIYYVKSIESFVQFIKKISNENTKIIIASPEPNFAVLSKFIIQENYPPYFFYHSSFLINFFNKNSFAKEQITFNKRNNIFEPYMFTLKHHLSSKKKIRGILYSLGIFFIFFYYIFRNIFRTNFKLKSYKFTDFILVLKKK